MKIIAVVGSSGSGKTQLIERLVAEFIKRNARPAVVKHCPHGFEAEGKAKDSGRFLRAGATAVGLVGRRSLAIYRRTARPAPLSRVAALLFPEADIVLVEGGSRAAGLKKIEVLAAGIPAKPVRFVSDVVAFVSELPLRTPKPVFRPGQVSRIARFIEAVAPVVHTRMRPEARPSAGTLALSLKRSGYAAV